jgi:hypothetical protein
MMAALIVVAAVLALLAAIASLTVYAAAADIREQIQGERMARWLSQYHYPSGQWRPNR